MTLKVTINDKMLSKPFSFTAHAKDVEATIARGIDSLDGEPSGAKTFMVIATKSGKVYLAALAASTFVLLHIPKAVAASSGVFGVVADDLSGVIKNRGDMEFSFTEDQECTFKLVKGKYAGKIVTLPVTDDMLSLFNDTFSSKATHVPGADFSPETLELFKEGIAATAIKDVFHDHELNCYIMFSKHKLTIASQTMHHFGFYVAKTDYKGTPFSIAAPISHFQLIDKLISGYNETKEDVAFSIQETTLRVDADSFVIVMPLTQVVESNYELVPGYIADAGSPTLTSVVDAEQIAKVVENLYTLFIVNTTFDFTYKENTAGMRITYVTPKGAASDLVGVIPSKVKLKGLKLDPRVFRDVILLSRSYKDVTLKVMDGTCLMLDTETKLGASLTFVCSLV